MIQIEMKKEAEVAIHISHKIEFQETSVTKDKKKSNQPTPKLYTSKS